MAKQNLFPSYVRFYLDDIRNGFEEFDEFGETVKGHLTLVAEMVVVSRDEFVEKHRVLRSVV